MAVSIGLIRTYANMVYYGHMDIADVPVPYVLEVEALLSTYSTDPITPDYVHPLTHPATMIVEDTTHRFITEDQIDTWDSKAEGGHYHRADEVSVMDSNNRFTSTTVEDVLDELFLNANDIKTKWSSVVGSPLTSSDTSTLMHSKTQTLKNTLAQNLSAKGVASIGTSGLSTLVDKVALISTGKKSYSGRVTLGWDSSSFSVSGLTFTPKSISVRILDATDGIGVFKGFASWVLSTDGTQGYTSVTNGTITRMDVTTTATGFSLANLARPSGTLNHYYDYTASE
jgi:hypothetical protein